MPGAASDPDLERFASALVELLLAAWRQHVARNEEAAGGRPAAELEG